MDYFECEWNRVEIDRKFAKKGEWWKVGIAGAEKKNLEMPRWYAPPGGTGLVARRQRRCSNSAWLRGRRGSGDFSCKNWFIMMEHGVTRLWAYELNPTQIVDRLCWVKDMELLGHNSYWDTGMMQNWLKCRVLMSLVWMQSECTSLVENGV